MIRIGTQSFNHLRAARGTGWRTLAFGIIASMSAPVACAQDVGVVERITYPRPASLREVTGPGGAATDPITGRRYLARVIVETGGATVPTARFDVHVPHGSLLGIGRRSARLLAILWGLAERRFGVLNARLRSGCADVWICRDGDAGGEQTRTSIYLYDAMGGRSDFEWARTIAHEYGHYLLPGPSGYTDPESWSNGIFGERLFTGWIRDELRSGRLTPDDTALMTLPSVEDYCAKQVDPLIERIATGGPDTERLARKDKQGMDEAIALLLYADRIHGARAIPSLLEWMRPSLGRQPNGPDYLEAYRTWLDSSESIIHRPLGDGRYMAYLPAGKFTLQQATRGRFGIAVEDGQTSPSGAGISIRMPRPGWKRVTITPKADMPDVLTWVRQRPSQRSKASADLP